MNDCRTYHALRLSRASADTRKRMMAARRAPTESTHVDQHALPPYYSQYPWHTRGTDLIAFPYLSQYSYALLMAPLCAPRCHTSWALPSHKATSSFHGRCRPTPCIIRSFACSRLSWQVEDLVPHPHPGFASSGVYSLFGTVSAPCTLLG